MDDNYPIRYPWPLSKSDIVWKKYVGNYGMAKSLWDLLGDIYWLFFSDC